MVEQTFGNSPPSGAPPRRAAPRAALQVDVTLVGDDNFFTGLATDISSGGLFVATYTPRVLGSTVALELQLPGCAEPIQTSAQVRWVRGYREGGDGVPGMGLQFLDLRPADEAAIAQFVAQRAPIFWDDEENERTPVPTTLAATEDAEHELVAFAPESLAPIPFHRTSRVFRIAAPLGAGALVAGLAFVASQALLHPSSTWLEAPADEVALQVASPTMPVEEPPPVPAEPAPEAAAIPPVALEPVPAPDPGTLAPSEGWLFFARPEAASVYVNGKLLGPTNTPLRALCGLKNVRLAQPTPVPSNAPAWLGAGQPVRIACGALTPVGP